MYDTLFDLSLVLVNAGALFTCIIVWKNVRTNQLIEKAKKAQNEKEGNKQKALNYINKALKLSPKDVTALSNKAVLLRNMGEQHYNEAIEYYNKATVMARDFHTLTTISYHLGALYCNMGNYEEAKKRYDYAMSNEDIMDDEFWNNLGILNIRTSNYNEALRCFNKSLAINPECEIAKENKKELLCLIAQEANN